MIISEDVTYKHYELYKSFVNFDDAKVVTEKLARFHAASCCLLKNIPNKIPDDLFSGLIKAKPNPRFKIYKYNKK